MSIRRRYFDVNFLTLFRRLIQKLWNIDVHSTTFEILMLFQRPSKYFYVFNCFSTSKLPAGFCCGRAVHTYVTWKLPSALLISMIRNAHAPSSLLKYYQVLQMGTKKGYILVDHLLQSTIIISMLMNTVCGIMMKPFRGNFPTFKFSNGNSFTIIIVSNNWSEVPVLQVSKLTMLKDSTCRVKHHNDTCINILSRCI